MPEHDQGDWDGGLYAANSSHHRATDDVVVEDLQQAGVLRPDARILDVGCGHGDLTARLAELVPDGEVVGIDASADMVETAARLHQAPNLRFAHVPAQELASVVEAGSRDAVVSVACLHWVPREDHPSVLRQIATVLRPGGVLRADFGGRGQISAPRVVLDEESEALGGPTDPWYFPSAEDYAPLVEAAGLTTDGGRLRLLHQRRSFPDADALLGMLRSQTYMAYDGTMSAQDRATFHARVDERAPKDLLRHDGTYDLDFVRVDLVARLAVPVS
jgi:trans-aconitate methyltransferase